MEADEKKFDIEIQKTSFLNYALQQNKLPIIQQLVIHNKTAEDYHNVQLKIWSVPEMVKPFELNLEILPSDTPFLVKDVVLHANAEYLAGLTERVVGTLYLSLSKDEVILQEENYEMTALAFDEWHGSLIYPELLVSFVTPNHPEVIKINAKAANILGKWTGDSSLDAYQTKNSNRVVMQAAAVYAALLDENIVYSVPPASFETIGQRVRLCDTVIQQKMGTCLDLTLFYVSCLEAIGLHPILLLEKSHIYTGLWLEEDIFQESVGDDPAQITKRLANGVNEIIVVECTSLVEGRKASFDDAVLAAKSHLYDISTFQLYIDVKRARLSGVRPLPTRIQEADGWRIEKDSSEDNEQEAPTILRQKINVSEEVVNTPAGKMAQWERKLLDLGLRNSLINLRFSQSIIPLLFTDLYDLEDALAQGHEYGIAPKLAEWNLSENENCLEQLKAAQQFRELLQTEFQNKRLRTTLTQAELDKTIVNLYRTSRTSLEENGANTLYLAVGFLRWYETKASQKPRYAPIVLLPVEMIRKSANKGYVIRLRDEEPQMNITLLEMLKQDFGINITGLDPLPQDEHGVDIRAIFTTMCKAVMGQNRWDVLEASCLGNFSFSQFVMWNDVRNRSEDIKKNKIVNSLIEGRLTWDSEALEIGERVSEEDVFLPIPVDASQLFAVKAAAEGKSFVLHGPPGTGKSQTITVMIANALAQGKTVIFVAEKMAALSVVQNRLNSIGLGPFCLEVHSNKSKKSYVLEQLRIATEVGKKAQTEEYERKVRQIGELRKELDEYSHALHKKQKCGLSLYQMINGYDDLYDISEEVHFSGGIAENISDEILDKQKVLVQRMIVAARAIGHPKNNPLKMVGRSTYSNQIRMELENVLRGYEQTLSDFDKVYQKARSILELPEMNSFSEIKAFMELCNEIYAWREFPETWNQYRKTPHTFYEINQMSQLYQSCKDEKGNLQTRWTDEFLNQNGSELKDEWLRISNQWFLPKILKQNKFIKRLRPWSKQKLNKEAIDKDLQALKEYQNKLQNANGLYDKYQAAITDYYRGDDTDWNSVAALADRAKESLTHLSENSLVNRVKVSFSISKEYSDVFAQLKSAYDEMNKQKDELYCLLEIAPEVTQRPWIVDQMEMIRNISEHSMMLKEWIIWQGYCKEAKEILLEDFIQAYYNGLSHEMAEKAYYKGLYKSLVNLTVDKEEVLRSFSGVLFNEKIGQFKRLDREITELAKAEIYYRLAARIPNFTLEASSSSELGILQKAIRSNGRGISVRKLFEQIPNLLPRLCPCMLMSPISAAQYLDPKRKPFDLVIFDEASQIPTCKAVGALARGENAIIVGDPKQMPPTTFFMGNTVDEENIAEEDLESILDDCLALNIPQTHLLWHYRSRHESLIAFSNNCFYESKLYTFPSVNNRESKVTLIPVEGYFDRGKTRQNRGEAEAIVNELIRRCYDEELSCRSVGIVTFNLPQQHLIEDLFLEACKSDSKLEDWAYNSSEPIFIKNLENVQGDERDAILFSVGYGPDKEGNMYMNFGPLNREGGWRRLNVAVSRSRYEMMVFSTLKPDQIDLSRTASEGVAALKAFLDYAANTALTHTTETVKENAETYTGVANHIADELTQKGYKVEKNIGHSKIKVDLGVVDPKDPNKYLLGILLDGPVYGNSKTTRDREVAQINVLKGLGWNIHRIWTVDWWDNKDKEMNKLLTYLSDLKNGKTNGTSSAEMQENKCADHNSTYEVGGTNTSAGANKYSSNCVQKSKNIDVAKDRYLEYKIAQLECTPLTSDEFLQPQNQILITKKILQVIEAEAPVTEGLLVRRVLQSFGINRAGTRIQSKMENLLRLLKIPYSEFQGQKTFWKKKQVPDGYKEYRISSSEENKRDAKDVPVIEMTNAIRNILEEQIGLPKEDLIREVAKRIGYARSGTVVISSINNGIDYGISRDMFKISDNQYMTLAN